MRREPTRRSVATRVQRGARARESSARVDEKQRTCVHAESSSRRDAIIRERRGVGRFTQTPPERRRGVRCRRRNGSSIAARIAASLLKPVETLVVPVPYLVLVLVGTAPCRGRRKFMISLSCWDISGRHHPPTSSSRHGVGLERVARVGRATASRRGLLDARCGERTARSRRVRPRARRVLARHPRAMPRRERGPRAHARGKRHRRVRGGGPRAAPGRPSRC